MPDDGVMVEMMKIKTAKIIILINKAELMKISKYENYYNVSQNTTTLVDKTCQ